MDFGRSDRLAPGTDARAWAERNGHTVIATAADKISGRTSP